MKKKNSLILDDEFLLYCQLNNIEDIEKTAKETFNRGFTLLKYGETPMSSKTKEKIVEKEIIKEVPVEKIVEKIIEIPVEKIVEIIKEVPVKGDTTTVVQEVIKEVVVENKEEIKKLMEENNRLKEEIRTINKSLETLNKAKYLKSSDLNNLYGE